MSVPLGIAITFAVVFIGLYPVWKARIRRGIERRQRDYPDLTQL